MQTAESIRRRIESAEDLQSVVTTMKAMAATSIRQYRQAVAALADYDRTVAQGLQIVLRGREEEVDLLSSPSAAEQQIGVVVFGSDQGLAGRFNDAVVNMALDELNAMHISPADRQVVAVGRRAATKLAAGGQSVIDEMRMPTSLNGVSEQLRLLMRYVENWWLGEQVDRVFLFYNHPQSGASYEQRREQLVPVDVAWLQTLQTAEWEGPTRPFHTLEWRDLFAYLIQEHLFTATHRAFAASLAAENAGRLSSMQAAERNIDERLNELNHQYQQVRQSSITAELLDIVSGAEAVQD